MDQIVANLSKFVPQLRGTLLLPGCGHWTQQEPSPEVNQAVIEVCPAPVGSIIRNALPDLRGNMQKLIDHQNLRYAHRGCAHGVPGRLGRDRDVREAPPASTRGKL